MGLDSPGTTPKATFCTFCINRLLGVAKSTNLFSNANLQVLNYTLSTFISSNHEHTSLLFSVLYVELPPSVFLLCVFLVCYFIITCLVAPN